MSGKNKNHNSIIFLTTLSVYLGLVIVGAAPQVLAQTAHRNEVSILLPGEGYVLSFDLNPFIELNKLLAKSASPTKVSGKLVPLLGKSTEWQIATAAGDQKVVDFLRREFFTPAFMDSALQQALPIKELSQSIEIDADNITFAQNTVFANAQEAVKHENIYRKAAEYSKSPAVPKKVGANLYITNTQVRAENNQLFIVTRLPRAAIDLLIK